MNGPVGEINIPDPGQALQEGVGFVKRGVDGVINLIMQPVHFVKGGVDDALGTVQRGLPK